MSRFQRSRDPDRPGQVLLADGEPVATVFWAHDFSERAQTGWFMALLGEDGEPYGVQPRRLDVSEEVAQLLGDAALDRAAWLARAETVELVTAAAAVETAERTLERVLGGTHG